MSFTGFCNDLLPSTSPWLFAFSSLSLFYRSIWGYSLNSNFSLNHQILYHSYSCTLVPTCFSPLAFVRSRSPGSLSVDGLVSRGEHHIARCLITPPTERKDGDRPDRNKAELSQKALIRSLWPIGLHRSPLPVSVENRMRRRTGSLWCCWSNSRPFFTTEANICQCLWVFLPINFRELEEMLEIWHIPAPPIMKEMMGCKSVSNILTDIWTCDLHNRKTAK